MGRLIISLAALIPVVIFCWYIYSKDKQEKEPIGLLTLLFLVGAVSYFPAILAENSLIGVTDKIFSGSIEYSLTGFKTFKTESTFVFYSLISAFFAIALTEEIMKWVLLYFITHKNKNFDHLFDGVIYATFLSLGFAAAENIFYAIRDGWGVFILRSLTSLPSQMTFGVLMGFFYTMWKIFSIAVDKEKSLENQGMIKIKRPFNTKIWLVLCIIVPVILHGCYAFFNYFASTIMTIIFYAFVILLYVICFVGVRWFSELDCEGESVAERMVSKKYSSLNKREKSKEK